MGDNRIEKNINDGASKCKYALIILSKDTEQSICAMEEISILKKRYYTGDIVLFPVLYELSPNDIPNTLQWIKELIFKEVDRHTGSLEVCNHIACKITNDILTNYHYKNISDFLNQCDSSATSIVYTLLNSYQTIDYENFNSRIAILYATYLSIIHSKKIHADPTITIVSKTFEWLFSETRLNLTIDYRELWLLENCICILINYYTCSCIESKI